MIEFVVNERIWKNESDVAKRVAAIVGEPNPWSEHAQLPCCHQGKWQIDSGNDWFMNKLEGNRYQLRYRYTTEQRQKALDGLKLFLEYTFE